MDLIGKTVHHKIFGDGIVIKQSNEIITVKFSEKETRFVMQKNIFNELLSFAEPKDQEDIMEYFDAQEEKALERAKQEELKREKEIKEEKQKALEEKQKEEKQRQIERIERRRLAEERRKQGQERRKKTLEAKRLERKKLAEEPLLIYEEGSSTIKLNRRKARFSSKLLAYIGALDDFYDLFCQVQFVYDSLIQEKNIEKDEKGRISSYDHYAIKREARPKVKKLLRPVIIQYSYLFVDPPQIIGLNSTCLIDFYMYIHMKNNNLISKPIDCDTFLLELMSAMCTVIKNKEPAETNRSWKEIWNSLNDHFCDHVEKELNALQNEFKEDTPTFLPIYVFDRLYSTRCYRAGHAVNRTAYIARRKDDLGVLRLPAHYCEQCDKYFIGRQTLNLYEKDFGKLAVKKKRVDVDESDFDQFEAESKLHLLGYNVINGEYTEPERQRILVHLLKTNRMSYLEICSTIEQNIRIFENTITHQLAVQKWKKDLKFLGDYIIQAAYDE